MTSDHWKTADTEMLQMLFSAGLQYREIARRLGRTKNMISGRLWRMGLDRIRSSRSTFADRMDVLNVFPPYGSCLYGIGDPHKEGFRFCGEPGRQGSAYCAKHHARTYTKTIPKAEMVKEFRRAV